MITKNKLLGLILLVAGLMTFLGCTTASRHTVELSEVTVEQVAEIQKSHIRFVQLYYQKLREQANIFIDERWTPVFLAEAVKNEEFRKELDDSYAMSKINASDIQVTLRGGQLNQTQRTAVLGGVEKVVSEWRGRLGEVMLGFSEAAEREIRKRRQALLREINEQERMVVSEINAAYADLQGAQATIKAYLASVVELKENQDLVLEKLGVLKRSEAIMNAAIEANETLSVILDEKENAKESIKKLVDELEKAKDRIRAGISATKSSIEVIGDE